MSKQGTIVKNTIAFKYHFFFWVCYFLINFVRWGSYFNDYTYSLKSNLVEFPLHILIVYFNIYFLIPRLLLKKRYLTYFSVLLLALGVHYSIRTGLNFYLVSEDIWPEAIGVQKPFSFNHILAVSIGELYVLSLTAAIKFTVEYLNERTKNRKLRELQYQTELNYLKAQMQPHFFFNTLNNLYGLTLKGSSQASDVVLRLSDFMKYVIYDAEKKEIPLLKEIEYIDNYIALEKLRHGLNFGADISITGDIDDVLVPPLLFLPLVENAFKHGVKNQKKQKITIGFELAEKELIFTIQNYFDPEQRQQIQGGIGLVNLKRRLQMLYNRRYSLKNQADNNQYIVTLIIPIA